MSYYQVFSTYQLNRGKPSLVSITLHSSLVYYPYLVGCYTSYLSHSRYFHTIPEAQDFISYLYKRFPNYTAPRPKLDALQLTFAF